MDSAAIPDVQLLGQVMAEQPEVLSSGARGDLLSSSKRAGLLQNQQPAADFDAKACVACDKPSQYTTDRPHVAGKGPAGKATPAERDF